MLPPISAVMLVFTVVPRMPMVATGVSTRISPVLATCPATKVIEPFTRLKMPEFELLAES